MGNTLMKKIFGGERIVRICACCGKIIPYENGKQYCIDCEKGVKEVDIDEVINRMLERFGEDSQIDVAIEEMSELTKELIKYKRSKLHFRERQASSREHVIEEISDVLFMFEYLKMIFGISEAEIERQIKIKAGRTKERYLNNGTGD